MYIYNSSIFVVYIYFIKNFIYKEYKDKAISYEDRERERGLF